MHFYFFFLCYNKGKKRKLLRGGNRMRRKLKVLLTSLVLLAYVYGTFIVIPLENPPIWVG
ncbi:hypothetical protein TTE0788 [Caldanaerobacter subterraneus subsp. tengcongensis MB4]|uniref:Uncharacterized protein n=1 Tax=Caldanaerobacter subterraneus subsp. tengcongensis (strain DSM 15242 / JCM 11007 / NBRC 100824 / MB4) TaxID=273068 RepID=Q8RBM9_CALS4|nr:hypothetical protein TTE0788 [Caldanaerobacter subterraneus subsp. tengcongensis MB4]